MKTAMQELRCLVQSMLQNGGDDDLWAVLSHIDDKLEKEKEQIINARNHWKEQEETAFDDDFVWSGDEYYNKMYNNK